MKETQVIDTRCLLSNQSILVLHAFLFQAFRYLLQSNIYLALVSSSTTLIIKRNIILGLQKTTIIIEILEQLITLARPLLDSFNIVKYLELLNIANIATRAFRFSPVFKFKRPFYEQFPKDILASYYNLYRDAIGDKGKIYFTTKINGNRIVSIISITLLLNSELRGYYLPDGNYYLSI